jgi:hypothetical protein
VCWEWNEPGQLSNEEMAASHKPYKSNRTIEQYTTGRMTRLVTSHTEMLRGQVNDETHSAPATLPSTIMAALLWRTSGRHEVYDQS